MINLGGEEPPKHWRIILLGSFFLAIALMLLAPGTVYFINSPAMAQEFQEIPPSPDIISEISEVPEIPEVLAIEEPDSIYCSCIQTARAEGLDIPRFEYAGYIDPNVNRKDVRVGDGILLSYNVEHLAYIYDIQKDGYHIVEGNFKECEKTYRVIDYEDNRIRGFYRP